MICHSEVQVIFLSALALLSHSDKQVFEREWLFIKKLSTVIHDDNQHAGPAQAIVASRNLDSSNSLHSAYLKKMVAFSNHRTKTAIMNISRKRDVRPEEALLLALLAAVFFVHLILRTPYVSGAWIMQQWVESPSFRLWAQAGVFIAVLAFLCSVRGWTRPSPLLEKTCAAVRSFLPFGFMYVIYEGVHALGPRLHRGVFDQLLLHADQMLFGTHGFLVVPMGIMDLPYSKLITYYFAFCYSAIFVVYWGLGIYFFFCVSERIFRKYMLSIVLTSFLGYVCYMVFPAIGPYEAFIRPGFIDLQAWAGYGQAQLIARFADHIRCMHLDRMPASDGFPSLHTAWTLIVTGFAWRHARWLVVLLLPWGLGTIVGALYFQQHYMIDILAGVPAAIAGTIAAAILVDGAITARQPRHVFSSAWNAR